MTIHDKFKDAPTGATHLYEHGGVAQWYREASGNLFAWRDGSWYESFHRSAEELAKVCMLGRVTPTPTSLEAITGTGADWFERGELPPFGLEVEWKPWSDAPWVKAVIMADAGDGEYVIRVDGVKKIVGSPTNFRPIRNEREILFDLLQKHDLVDEEACTLIDAIQAAGFKRDGGAA